MSDTLSVTGRDGTRYVAVRKKYRYPYGKTREGWLISKNSGEDRHADDFTSALCDALLAARREWVACRIIGGDAEANTVTIEVPTARGVTMNATLHVSGLPAPPEVTP